jgi:hypothetical protein
MVILGGIGGLMSKVPLYRAVECFMHRWDLPPSTQYRGYSNERFRRFEGGGVRTLNN